MTQGQIGQLDPQLKKVIDEYIETVDLPGITFSTKMTINGVRVTITINTLGLVDEVAVMDLARATQDVPTLLQIVPYFGQALGQILSAAVAKGLRVPEIQAMIQQEPPKPQIILPNR